MVHLYKVAGKREANEITLGKWQCWDPGNTNTSQEPGETSDEDKLTMAKELSLSRKKAGVSQLFNELPKILFNICSQRGEPEMNKGPRARTQRRRCSASCSSCSSVNPSYCLRALDGLWWEEGRAMCSPQRDTKASCRGKAEGSPSRWPSHFWPLQITESCR